MKKWRKNKDELRSMWMKTTLLEKNQPFSLVNKGLNERIEGGAARGFPIVSSSDGEMLIIRSSNNERIERVFPLLSFSDGKTLTIRNPNERTKGGVTIHLQMVKC